MRTASLAHPGRAQELHLPLPILIAGFCLLWASAFSVAKLAVGDCPPLLVLTARFLLAGVVMLGAGAFYGLRFNLTRRDVVIFSLLGIANQAAYLGLSYVAWASAVSRQALRRWLLAPTPY